MIDDMNTDITYSEHDAREHFTKSLISIINNISFFIVYNKHVEAFNCLKIMHRLTSGVLTKEERESIGKSEKLLKESLDVYRRSSRSHDIVQRTKSRESYDSFCDGVVDHLGLVCDYLHSHRLLLPIWTDSEVSADNIDFSRLDSEAGK